MKKKINIIYLLFMLFLILLNYTTKSSNILTLVLSSSLSILLYNTFSELNINSTLEKYKNKYKIYKITIIFISLLFIVFSILSFLMGSVMSIKGLNIINVLGVLFTLTIIIIKITSIFLEYTKYKKLGNKLFNVYLLLILLVSSISSILLYQVFKLNDYIKVLLLYSVNIVIFIIIILLLYIFILRKNKVKVREKYNYKEIIKNILNINKSMTIYNLIKEGYIYTSIIILYYTLVNKYNYSYENTSIIIVNVYFYGIYFIKYISYILKKHLEVNSDNFSRQIIKVSNYLIKITILLMIISGPICKILFSNNNFLFDLVVLIFFYTLYNYAMDISIKVTSSKINKISLLSGLIVKLVFEIPLINTSYRIGSSLYFGSILSIIIGMTTSTIISIIFINKKLKISILNNFSNILNIIYENIILCLILVLLTLILKVENTSIIGSILVIIFYTFITILFYIVKKILKKKV